LDFPQFDGDNPQFWKTKCEKYFDVYGVSRDVWVRVATLHFTGNAARWLQLYESGMKTIEWEELCAALCSKFGRDQYQAQLRQFAQLVQTSSVSDYMTQFEELMHNLLAHNPGFD
uniref:Retrotransposon gag domain-containing protein n=1 Tax=Aegilops tauschii subsp. strangulata TaxID=200361 RepID=A0A453H676_AEGTS